MRSGHFVLKRVSKYFECYQSSNPFHTHFLLFRKWQEFGQQSMIHFFYCCVLLSFAVLYFELLSHLIWPISGFML